MGLRPKIFVSSTFSDLTYEREFVSQVCEEMGFETLSFPEGSVAGAGTRDYLHHEREAQILVYLVTKESEAVAEEIELARKLGLFIIPLARSKEALEKDANPGWHTNLPDLPRFEKRFDSLASLRSAVREGVSEAVALRLDDRRSLAEWSTASYSAAARQVASVVSRFGLVQDTSSLLLGPRVGRITQEKEFIATVDAFVRRMSNRVEQGQRPLGPSDGGAAPAEVGDTSEEDAPKPRSALDQWDDVFFVHLFHAPNTYKNKDVDSASYPFANDRLEVLKSLYLPLMEKGLIAVAGVSEDVSPILICDNSCEIGTKLAGRVYYGRYSEYGPSAGNLWGALREEALHGDDLNLQYLTSGV